MGDKAETVWEEVYERVRRRVRVLAGLILALAFAAVFDGLANYDRLGDEYQRAIDLVLNEAKDGGAREAVTAAFVKARGAGAPAWKDGSTAIVVDLRDIRPLYRRYLRGLAPQSVKETFRVGTYALERHAYVLALIFGPLIISAALLWPLVSIRQLHRRLAPQAEPGGATQQKLNSLFFDRITDRYGEGWRRHVLGSLGVLLMLCLIIPVIFGATRSIVGPDLRVAITADGQISPLDDDPLLHALVIRRGNPVVSAVMGANLLTLITFLVLARVAITVPHAAKPDDATGLST